jgi:hypothetical protein
MLMTLIHSSFPPNSLHGVLVFLRPLSSSSAHPGSNKDWLAMKRENKERRDREWRKRRDANPFKENTGVGRKMKQIGIDPDDPNVETFRGMGSAMDPAAAMEELYDMTEKSEREFYPARKQYLANRPDPERMAYIMTKKRYFPDRKEPELLTWMEKQMMRHLNMSDPVTWSKETLAESFPATEKVVANVLRDGYVMPPLKVREHDEKVEKNWKLLANGELEVGAELKVHLQLGGGSGGGGIDRLMSSERRFQVEQKVIDHYEKSLQMPRIKPGAFGNIIVDYNKKVKAKREAQGLVVAGRKDVALVSDHMASAELFSKRSFDPNINVASPSRDTAFLQSRVDLSTERKMTMDKFRNKYLRNISTAKKLVPQQESEGRPDQRTKFLEWLVEERKKDKRVTTPMLMSAEDVEKEDEPGDIFTMSRFKTDKFVKNEDDVADAEANIVIPAEKYKRGSVFRKGNAFYSDQGELLYRVPTETMGGQRQ